jgi:hypothetical protein
VETAWTSAAGVDVEDAISFFNQGSVGVTGYDAGDSSGLRVDIKGCQIVKDVNALSLKFDGLCGWDSSSPSTSINITPNNSDWGNGSESIQDFRFPYISGMDDVLDILERFNGFRTEQAVCV